MFSARSIAQDIQSFELDAGDAGFTLKQFAKQATLSIVYDPRRVEGIQTQEVVGMLSPKDALERMLEGTPLVFKEDLESGAFAVTRLEIPSLDQTTQNTEPQIMEETEMKPKKNWIRKSLLSILTLGVVGSTADLSAQEEDEIVYELSPFTVDASEDSGYLAQNTLAGTRLKSSLRDVASSIQVATKEFMEDVGATDSSELLVYLTNTETGGMTGNFSGVPVSAGRTATGSARAEPQNAQRVRGLFTADLTRNYFKTIIPFDSYNTTRIEVNRGSNAILFGLGSPAGIINNSLIESSFSKDFGNLTVRVGEYESIRTSFNVNHVLIEDKLSVRVAGLYDNRNFKQRPAEETKERYFVTSKWKPFENTTIKGSFEHGRVRANRPETVAPIENVSMWLALGKPIMDYRRALRDPTGIFVDLDGDGTLEEAPANLIKAENTAIRIIGTDGKGNLLNEGNFFVAGNGAVRGQPYAPLPGARTGLQVAQPRFWQQGTLVWSDPNSLRPDMPGFVGSPPQNQFAPGDALDQDGQVEVANFVSVRNKDRFFANFNRQGFQDASAFDFVNNMLSGGASFQNQDFQNFNASLEQLFMDGNLGFELAYDHQEFSNDWFTPLQDNASAIFVDINTVLPDGRDNPNVGRPYVDGRQSKNYYEITQNASRATAFYIHDFTEKSGDSWAKWLGKYTFTGLYSERKERRDSHSSKISWDDGDFLRVLGVPSNITHFNSQQNPLFYVGPSLIDINSLDEANITRIGDNARLWTPGDVAPVTYWDPGVQPGTTNQPAKDDAVNLADGRLVTRDILLSEGISSGQIEVQDIQSKAFITQAEWLNGHIVGTAGWREDDASLTRVGNAPKDSKNSDILSRLEDEGSRVVDQVKEDRWTWGVVGHWPTDRSDLPFGARFSVHYGESSNFQPLAGRVDFDNHPIPSPSGETTEKGFSVSLFEDKLFLRVNWYDTKLVGKTSSARFETLTNNTVFQKAQFFFNAAELNSDPQIAALNRAAANALLAGATNGENERYNPEIIRNNAGESIGLNFAANVNGSDTEDLAAKGKEIELVYNPTKNWRIMFNAAQQETVRTNLLPRTENELIPLREALYNTPVPGFEFVKIGELSANGVADDSIVEFDPSTGTYVPDEGIFSMFDYLEGGPTFNKIAFRTAKASEGSIATEQREWRFNLINNYTFTEGFLEGYNIGGAYRWQDRAAIGFPFIQNADGATVGDVLNPFFAPSESNVDLWAGYTTKIFDGAVRWRISLNVRNVFSSESDIIPIQSQPDGSYSRVRFAPQREFFLTSSFDF